MRRIARIALGVLLAVGGCTGAALSPVVTVLTVGTYTGTLTCTGTRTDASGSVSINDTLDASVGVTGSGQLSIYGDDYVPSRTTTATNSGVTITQTVDSITQNGDTVSVKTTGTIDGQGKKFNTTHEITIRQIDPTHVELIDTESSVDSANGVSLQQECGGTLAQ